MATTTADKGFSEASIWGCGKCETFTTHSVPEMKLHYLHAHGLNFLVDMRKVWLAEHPVLAGNNPAMSKEFACRYGCGTILHYDQGTDQLHIVKKSRVGGLAPIIHAENIRYHNREDRICWRVTA